MITSKFVQTEEDFLKVMPLVLRFYSKTSDRPLHENLKEVCEWSDGKVVLLVEKDSKPEGYVCGWFTDSKTFYISQAFASSPPIGQAELNAITVRVKEIGATCIRMMTPHPTRLFEKKGFKLKRHIMEKEI